jgi:glycine/D-amino acid oxidase-like deaminating enzyme
MQTDVLIIGQGICGTFLSRELERAGLSFLVIDEERPATASRAAAGLINPVTGRRMVKTWMIDELLPFAREVYGEGAGATDGSGGGGGGGDGSGGNGNGGGFIRPVSVVDFFPTAQMRLAFLDRYAEDPQYLRLPADEHHWDAYFHYELGYGCIEPCYLVDIQRLLGVERKKMVERGVLRAEQFMAEDLEVGDRLARYRDVEARWAIFCDGIESSQNAYFSRLPFAPNKGEVLIIEAPDLPDDGASGSAEDGLAPVVFKKGMSIIPWKDGLYWIGSSYEWSFGDPGPTRAFRERTEALLKDWLRVPFRTVDHMASVRPATLERRPFVGLHPLYPAVGILNGMGTKGCSLAPYFARQLAELLVSGVPVRADANIGRFRKVLARG